MAGLNQRSLPADGCGWVVLRNEVVENVNGSRPHRRGQWWSTPMEDRGLRRVTGGVYRCRRHAESLCSNPNTTCNLVVWDDDAARAFFAAFERLLDDKSLADLAYYFGTTTAKRS